MKNRIMHQFILMGIVCSLAVGQYKEGNRIVTLSKYYLNPWRTVEGGDWKNVKNYLMKTEKKWISETTYLLVQMFFITT